VSHPKSATITGTLANATGWNVCDVNDRRELALNAQDVFTHYDLKLRPDPSRTILRPFWPEYPVGFASPDHSRARAIVDRVIALDKEQTNTELGWVVNGLGAHHRNVDDMLARQYCEVATKLNLPDEIKDYHKKLIGGYFSQEYSFEAAALFNPSITPHPQQTDVADGTIRFVLSLRGIGEGHISSVTFRTGTWTPGGNLEIDMPGEMTAPPIIEIAQNPGESVNVRLHCEGSEHISETVLFPVLPSQHQGIEDLRLVRFVDDDNTAKYYGTYTAFNGVDARSEMLSGFDFRSFEMLPLNGDAANAKGMALFPRKIAGRYAMLSRQDSENIWLVYSDNLQNWTGGTKLLAPLAPWEIIQVGNCGSPIEIDEGWLVLTHGVGAARNYCMGACLLDKHDPSRLLARTPLPILWPIAEVHGGYVPNVVYSCGALVHARTMLLPYAVADSFTAFASASVDDLLSLMTLC
jgi:predicted GH43/DUF377 family glycosyl hydrolase